MLNEVNSPQANRNAGKKDFFAHVKQNTDGNWAEPHYLSDHLNDTADKASKFASEFGTKIGVR